MTAVTLEPQYLYTLASMPRGFTTKIPVNNRCNFPYNTIVIDFLGNCLLCECDGWLPIPVGKVDDFQSIEALLNCEQSRMIQLDVEHGNFSWCAIDHCGIRKGNKIKTELSLQINVDESCNLHCPSCRRNPIMLTEGPEYEKKLKYIDRITQWLAQYDQPIHITTSGNGDPLASAVMRPLIKNFVPRHNQQFTIFTNGLLIKKQLQGLPILDHLREFKISVDAGSEQIYQDVRRPGRWNVLMENFDFIRDIGKQSCTVLNFALQNKNYQDLGNFVDLCEKYGFRGSVHDLQDWGTWSQIEPDSKDTWTIKNGIFDDHAVLKKSHPNHAHAKDMIQKYVTRTDITFSPNILQLVSQQATG